MIESPLQLGEVLLYCRVDRVSGSTRLRLAHFVSAAHLGDAAQAVYRHEKAIRGDDWRRLPAEHRAARAYLLTGDLTDAGRALADADTIAPAEVRYRPAARTLIAEIAHSGRAAASVA
ncbi:hypothetical protein [Micromonospora sp. NPDC005189]|uniref:hypothetical protein n=1 Tax=unclassified Micromonospora TaxID=2617518 RepID=UPI0033BD1925